MIINKVKPKEEDVSIVCKNLRTTCLLGGFFSPLVTKLWSESSPDKFLSIIISVFCSAIFFTMVVLTYKSKFVKNNAVYFLYSICYLATASVIYDAYAMRYGYIHFLVLIFVVFAVILVMAKLRHLVVYILTMMVLTGFSLLILHEPLVEKERIITILVIFCGVAYAHMKSKLDVQEDLIKSEEHYRNLVEISPEAIFVHQDGLIVYLNNSAVELVGAINVEQLIGLPILDIIHPDFREMEKERVKNALEGIKQDFVEQKYVMLDGREIEVASNIIALRNQRKPAIMNMLTDITLHKKTERDLIEAESKFRSLVESALIGVFLYQESKIVYANPYLEELLGYNKEELFEMDIFSLIYQDDLQCLDLNSIKKAEDSIGDIQQFRVIRKDGSVIYIEIHFNVSNLNNIITVIGTILNVTQKKKAEDQIKDMAYKDKLTGLPNRYMLGEFLEQTLCAASLEDNKKMALMFIDLDRFKIINDTLGHKYGDMILHQAAERLKNCIRKDDLVSRYGGDEFVIVLQNVNEKIIIQVANRILAAFHNPYKIGNNDVFSTPSIGISIFPNDGIDSETLIKNADSAMYFAKERGKNNYQFYNSELNKAVSRKMELESPLRKALGNNEFILHYQPQFDFMTGEVTGIEALIRWQHPVMGLISPMEFIPLAEETGLIVGIGEWVIRTACMMNKSWQDSGFAKVPIAVNVSAYQLNFSDITKTIKKVLQETKLEPQYLVVEITESIMQDTVRSTDVFSELRKHGVKVAIDDFGTGYSNLSLLKFLKIDILKIDPSFTRDILTNNNTDILIRNIINLSHDLNINIVAEGIEDEAQANTLRGHKCDIGQGYLFCRPLSDDKLQEILKGKQYMLH